MEGFIILYREEDSTDEWKVKETKETGTFNRVVETELTQEQIRECEFIVYRVESSIHKDELIHSGDIDEILKEDDI